MGRAQLAPRERILRALNHQETDRIPIWDLLWDEVRARWQREGMPADADLATFLGWDPTAQFTAQAGLRLPREVIEETEEYITTRESYGQIQRTFKPSASVHRSPTQYLDFIVKDRQSWERYRERLAPSRDRVDWSEQKRNNELHDRGVFAIAFYPVGLDINTLMVAKTTLFMAMVEDPEWVRDIIETATAQGISMLAMMMDEGFKFDCAYTCDDLGYRSGPFFSPRHYRELVFPSHKRFCDFCHNRGLKVILHSCGDIRVLIPDLIAAGFDCLNPLEVKAGMDLCELKRLYGDRLALQGGIDVRLMPAEDDSVIEEEVRSKIECAKQGGGYLYHSDHSVPEDVSLAHYQRLMALVHKYGTYD